MPRKKKKKGRRTRGKKTVRKARLPRTIKRAKRQTGSSNPAYDKRFVALPPGKRISRRGRIYYETRANRSDMSRKKRI